MEMIKTAAMSHLNLDCKFMILSSLSVHVTDSSPGFPGTHFSLAPIALIA